MQSATYMLHRLELVFDEEVYMQNLLKCFCRIESLELHLELSIHMLANTCGQLVL